MTGAEELKYAGNEIGILVCHGFTGTTQSIRPLVEAYAREGYTVMAPRLKGHGTGVEDLETTTYEDWINSTKDAMDWLLGRCDAVFVVGLSMGGTLMLEAATEFERVIGGVLINTAMDIPTLAHIDPEQRFIDSIGSDIKKGAAELTYDRTPTTSVIELRKLMERVRSKLSSVHCPLLLFVSEEDHVVPPHNSEMIFQSVFSERKELVHLENSYHVATLDYDQDLIIERSLEFFQRYTKTMSSE
ncbi:alpha/beta fold hydrolase [Halobacillus litoralis]|uniref:alpha/beta hydrolase n=1 Tax=Halobacillus litoralis TaxID=45668 RepID=UPI001CD77923|nr:alpha/beta fold hydrolase [Halobacillus litoralis]MCA0969518.1 alpha/beta fold hydrolase [Halobacillus litoralis]